MQAVRYEKQEDWAVDAGSGDVLVDLGFADAEERKLRVQLAMQVNKRPAA
jgi:hypothetical protein